MFTLLWLLQWCASFLGVYSLLILNIPTFQKKSVLAPLQVNFWNFSELDVSCYYNDQSTVPASPKRPKILVP